MVCSAVLQFVTSAWILFEKQQGCRSQLQVTWKLVTSWLFCKDPYVVKGSKEWSINLYYAWPISKGSKITGFSTPSITGKLSRCSDPRLSHCGWELWWFDFPRPSKAQRTELYAKNIQPQQHFKVPLSPVLPDTYTVLSPLLFSRLKRLTFPQM